MRLRARKDAIAGADFFTTEVWTWRGLVTVYTVFVIHRASRRVQILGSTPHPDEAFMRQVGRTLTMANSCRVLIGDRDTKWRGPVRECWREAEAGSSTRRIRRRTRMRTRNDLFGQSKKNASTGSFPWASVIFNKRYVDTSRTIITNGIIKAWQQADHRHTGAHDGFDSSPTAPGWITELLRTCGMTGRSAEQRDITLPI
jgi:hypothetical protein